MYILNLIEDKFNDLSLKTKLELFLFPLLILVLIWQLLFDDIDKLNNTYEKKFEINTASMPDKMMDIVGDIRNFALKNNIKINSLKTKEKIVDIKLETNINKQISFLKYLEEYNSFSAINYLKQNDEFLKLKLSFDTLYLKKDLVLENELKIFRTKNQTKENHKFNLEAIVGNLAYLNGKWYEKEQNIGKNFRLVEIKNDYVLILNGNAKFKVRLYKNDTK